MFRSVRVGNNTRKPLSTLLDGGTGDGEYEEEALAFVMAVSPLMLDNTWTVLACLGGGERRRQGACEVLRCAADPGRIEPSSL
jgi:hypothetical protein